MSEALHPKVFKARAGQKGRVGQSGKRKRGCGWRLYLNLGGRFEIEIGRQQVERWSHGNERTSRQMGAFKEVDGPS